MPKIYRPDGKFEILNLFAEGADVTQPANQIVFGTGTGVSSSSDFTFNDTTNALRVDGSAVFNENGDDYDFRIEGDTDSNLFNLDASTNRIGIGAAPTQNAKFYVSNSVHNAAFLAIGGAGSWMVEYMTATSSLGGYRYSTTGNSKTYQQLSENGDGFSRIELGSGEHSDTRPRWWIEKAATNPSQLKFICRLTTGSTEENRLCIIPSSSLIINDDGRDRDTIIEGDTDANLVFVNAGTDNVEMGGTGVTSAKLAVTSTTKGFLPPRMTGAQAEAISSPAEGLMVYATDGSGSTITTKGWWGYDGATWLKLN